MITVLLVSAVALAAGAGALRASVADPLPPTMQGPCQMRAEVQPSGTVVDPSVSGGVYAVPAVGLITYDAALSSTEDPIRRRLTGSVVLDLPPLFPDVTLGNWDEFGSLNANRGVQRYSLAEALAPTGATVRVRAQHQEDGTTLCRASLTLRLDGPVFGTLLRPIVVLFLVATAWLTARATLPRDARHDPWLGRVTHDERWRAAGRPGLGVLAGLAFGVCSALVLILSSAVALHSWWVSICPLVGVFGGLLLGWLGPPETGDRGAAGPSPSPDDAELPLLDPL